ncbi:MAG: fibronectin type III domain-containing protein [Halobacteriales archaeon]|nr:fibronectin type III domain-containing protein [Halobacteriales archaeon]
MGAESADGGTGVRYTASDFAAEQAGVRFFPCVCTAPDAPQGAGVQRNGAGSLRVAWSAPASDGGAPVRTYDVLRGSSSGSETLVASVAAGGSLQYDDVGLPSGTAFFYQVRARNFIGPGPASAEARGQTAGPPAAPVLSVQPGPGLNQITLAWTQSDDGGAPVSFFRLWRNTCSGCEFNFANVGSGTLSFTDSVSCCPRWFYRVSAVNAQGDGPLSNEGSAVVPQPPGPPQALSGTPGPGAGQVTLRWQAPANDGGMPVSAYRVYRQQGGGSFVAVADLPATLTFTDGGLPAGAYETYVVSARNGAGEGPTGGGVQVRVPTRPGAPQGLDARPGSDVGSVQLAWQAPGDDGGLPVTRVRVYRGEASGEEALVASLDGGATRFTDAQPGLLTVHYYRVTATNPVGEGAPSNEACTAPGPWGVVQPALGQPCPLPSGWVQATLLDETLALGGDTPVTPAVEQDVLTIDGRPWPGDPRYYVLDLRVAGMPLPEVRVFTDGLVTGDVHQALVHEPAHDLPVPVTSAHVTIVERHDPAATVCLLTLGDTCLGELPDPAAAGTGLGRAAIVVDVRLDALDGQAVTEQVLVVPFGGALLAGAPPAPGLPPLPL